VTSTKIGSGSYYDEIVECARVAGSDQLSEVYFELSCCWESKKLETMSAMGRILYKIWLEEKEVTYSK